MIQGFTFGFRVGFDGELSSIVHKNHKSANDNASAIEEYLKEEIKLNRIKGPFDHLKKPFHCAPMGVVPKSEPGKFRIIHDLSYPKGQSINDNISQEYTAVTYQSVYDAINMLQSLGQGSFMAKTDVSKAFRIIPLHEDDHKLFCMNWRDKFYIDQVMQMGCASSCQIFQAFASAIQWIAQQKLEIPNVNYLDDFMLGSVSKAIGTIELEKFLDMCADIGIPMAERKTFYPDTTMTFLGLEIDTLKNEVRLPMEKVKKCIDEIQNLLDHRKTRLQKLQSVIGILNFACQVVVPGRAFLRRLINLTMGVKAPHHWINISTAHDDLLIWLSFLQNHNGKVLFLDEKTVSNHDVYLYTDASGALGYGAIFGSQWFYGAWSSWWCSQHIMLLELYPIVIAMEIWGPQLQNKQITLFTDNFGLVPVLTKHTSRDSLVMILIRRLVLCCLRNNIVLQARWIKGSKNVLADFLSRLQIDKFKKACPWADKVPTSVPALPKLLD